MYFNGFFLFCKFFKRGVDVNILQKLIYILKSKTRSKNNNNEKAFTLIKYVTLFPDKLLEGRQDDMLITLSPIKNEDFGYCLVFADVNDPKNIGLIIEDVFIKENKQFITTLRHNGGEIIDYKQKKQLLEMVNYNRIIDKMSDRANHFLSKYKNDNLGYLDSLTQAVLDQVTPSK